MGVKKNLTRRQFIYELGFAGLVIPVTAPLGDRRHLSEISRTKALLASRKQYGNPAAPLYNKNWQTAIGLGDEPASIVDRFGQLRSDEANVPELANAARGGGSRNVKLAIAIGDPPCPASTLRASQWLEEGCLPIVHTRLHPAEGEFESVVFSSDWGSLKADYIGITSRKNSFRVTLLCPTTTSIKADQGAISASDKILALAPAPRNIEIRNARYSYLTPEKHSRVLPSAVAWEGLPTKKCPISLDSAFSGARTASEAVEYVFPVSSGNSYSVFLGIGRPEWIVGIPENFKVIKLTVEGQDQIAHFTSEQPESPVVFEFRVKAERPNIRIAAEGLGGGPLLSGIWIFDRPVNAGLVMSGQLNRNAIYYVACGRERLEDFTSSVTLEFDSPQEEALTKWIKLPYRLRPNGRQAAEAISPETAFLETKERWKSFLARGAQFETGIAHLDNLYRTSLINLFVLRAKYAGLGNGGEDIFVVKPGATVYDSFWYRDGSYIVVAMDVAGYADEAEKSLRLFTDPGLKSPIYVWGQRPEGLWACPDLEWDSQGQALWALVHHYELTADQAWLEKVYKSIRSGALWIKNATNQTKENTQGAEKPIFWGLLPKGVSEDTGSTRSTYVYEHDFWGLLGIEKARLAAKSLAQAEDAKWMSAAASDFRENLKSSIERAYRGPGQGGFIPGDPFDPSLDINGDITACYPTGFLEPRDPMVIGSLKRIARHSREDLYTWFKTVNNGDMWTYMTADWAMCCLLRHDLPTFYKLFQAYVNHASPTNAWVECIYSDTRLGTGDMPHGWAAAEYVLLHRNSLVYENGNDLVFCWGVHPDWVYDGAHICVAQAPTKFGRVAFDLRRTGLSLKFEHRLFPVSGQPKPRKILLNIPPPIKRDINSFWLNGNKRALSSEDFLLVINE